MIPNYPKLLWAGRRWFAGAVALFFAGVLLGFAAAASEPARVMAQLTPVLVLLRSIGEEVNASGSPVHRALVIYQNNLVSAMRMMAGGIVVGLLPAAGSLVNGVLLGIVVGLGSRLSPLASSPGLFLLSILPHGVFELPALWLGGAWGMRLGLKWLAPDALGRRKAVLGRSAIEAAQVFALVAALLLVAAFVEGNVTLSLVRAARA